MPLNLLRNFSYLLKLINLKGFNLSGIQISDLSPLDNLTNLTDLDLSDNHISDMPPLVNLTNLTELRLRSNPITDINSGYLFTFRQKLFISLTILLLWWINVPPDLKYQVIAALL